MKIINLSYRYLGEQAPEQRVNSFAFFYGIWKIIAQKDEVLFWEFIHKDERVTKDGLTFIFEKSSTSKLRFPVLLNWRIKRERPDVVVIHGLMFPLEVIMLRLALGESVKVVIQHHAEHSFRNPLKRWVQMLADQCTTAYFFTGKELATPWVEKKLINSRKVREIMECSAVFILEDRLIAREYTGISGKHTYLWVGHLNENKNPLLVLKAFTEFLKQGIDADLFFIYQSGKLLADMQKWLGENPAVAAKIHLIGRVDNQLLPHWYSSVDFMISSSYYESGGVAVCEGMACGCIPIVTDISSFRYMLNGSCGILYEAGDLVALLGALNSSIRMDKIAERERSLQQYHSCLSPEAIASNIQSVLKDL